MSLKKVVACIKRNKRFLITAHTNPEGDALGAELAFYRLLKKIGKQVVIVNEDDIPYGYEFLPSVKEIRKFNKSFKDIKFGCFVVLDCSDLKRCGDVSSIKQDDKVIINIDHHISNEKFGDINWVEPNASSVCEMIYRLYKKMHVAFDKDVATCLYAGILTDTGSFRYPNTSNFTHKIVSQLLRFNLNVTEIYKHIHENIPFSEMKILTRILPTIKRSAAGKIISFQIRRNLLKNKHLCFDLSEYILSFARAIKGIEVAVLFKENLGKKNEIRVNFRSQGKVDVNKIASFFGGGGHKTASGATIKGRIEEVEKKVLAKIRQSLR